MVEGLAVVLVVVLVFGGPVGCAVKALLGKNQCNFLPQKFINELIEQEQQS